MSGWLGSYTTQDNQKPRSLMSNPKKQYVSTLMFNARMTRAAFLVKNRPAFLANKLCPVGGQIEPGETPAQAAEREHFEETGVRIPADKWIPYTVIVRDDAEVHCFYVATDEVENCRTNEQEENFEEVYVLDIRAVFQTAMTPGMPDRIATQVLQDEYSLASDLVVLIGLVLRARNDKSSPAFVTP